MDLHVSQCDIFIKITFIFSKIVLEIFNLIFKLNCVILENSISIRKLHLNIRQWGRCKRLKSFPLSCTQVTDKNRYAYLKAYLILLNGLHAMI